MAFPIELLAVGPFSGDSLKVWSGSRMASWGKRVRYWIFHSWFPVRFVTPNSGISKSRGNCDNWEDQIYRIEINHLHPVYLINRVSQCIFIRWLENEQILPLATNDDAFLILCETNSKTLSEGQKQEIWGFRAYLNPWIKNWRCFNIRAGLSYKDFIPCIDCLLWLRSFSTNPYSHECIWPVEQVIKQLFVLQA